MTSHKSRNSLLQIKNVYDPKPQIFRNKRGTVVLRLRELAMATSRRRKERRVVGRHTYHSLGRTSLPQDYIGVVVLVVCGMMAADRASTSAGIPFVATMRRNIRWDALAFSGMDSSQLSECWCWDLCYCTNDRKHRSSPTYESPASSLANCCRNKTLFRALHLPFSS